MRSRLISIVVVTVIEAPAVYLWLRLHESGHELWALVVLVVGEVLETALAVRLVARKPNRGPAPGADATRSTHLKKVQRKVGAGGVAEIGIWVLWLAVADGAGQPVAAVVLLVIMHLKHHAELVAVRDIPFSTGLFSPTLTFASAMEAAGAVACLALIGDGRPGLAAVALGVGFSIEHTILVGKLHAEMESRDIRLPREARG